MGNLDNMLASGTILPNEILSHVEMAHLAIGKASRPFHGTLVVVPNPSGTIGVMEAKIIRDVTEMQSVLSALIDRMSLRLAR